MRKLIITGDDFGLAVPVNEAIEEAHRRGVLTSASLMIGAEAASDAVERAKQLPSLRVGLHVVLVDGRSVLSRSAVPDLVDDERRFMSDPVAAGIKYFFKRSVRRQLEAEIRSQFKAFEQTGLVLDHVNGHNHMHLHPVVLGLILKVGREFGLRAMRLPYEPVMPSWRASRQKLVPKIVTWLFLYPWIRFLKARLKRSGIRCNDFIFGLHESGHLRQDVLLRILRCVPHGVTEIYCHPATRRCFELDRVMPDYDHEQEFQALISPAVREAVAAPDFQRIAFSEL
jgi:hopanoid biosynthesis associated protein HpnK